MAPALTAGMPTITRSVTLRARNLGAQATTSTDASGATQTGTTNAASSLFGSGSSVLNFVVIVAVCAFFGAILLWRLTRLRGSGMRISPRSFFIPNGLRMRRLGIDIKPVERPLVQPRSPGGGYLPRAPRRSRRATTGPDIGLGGRRLSTAAAPAERDDVDEDGRSIRGDDELPSYDNGSKLPTYAQAWVPASLPADPSFSAVTESNAPPTLPSAPANEASVAPLSDEAYETYIRGLAPNYQDEAITRPPAALRRRDTDL